MDIVEEPRLFGIVSKEVAGVTLAIGYHPNTGHTTLMLNVHQASRRELLTLRITTDYGRSHEPVAAIIPILHRMEMGSVSFARRCLWAVHNRLGAQGYEVEIQNCGKDPKG